MGTSDGITVEVSARTIFDCSNCSRPRPVLPVAIIVHRAELPEGARRREAAVDTLLEDRERLGLSSTRPSSLASPRDADCATVPGTRPKGASEACISS
jgi:hypothetical protein